MDLILNHTFCPVVPSFEIFNSPQDVIISCKELKFVFLFDSPFYCREIIIISLFIHNIKVNVREYCNSFVKWINVCSCLGHHVYIGIFLSNIALL